MIRRFKRWLKQRQNLRLFVVWIIGFVIVLLYVLSMVNKNSTVNQSTLRPLLSLIADAESNDNYNAYFGNASNTSLKFTNMSIKEVQKWQAAYVEDGSPSSAVGRYQIIDTTLVGLVTELNIDRGQLLDKAMQDKMAIALIQRRGATEYVNDKLSAKQFAANLAQEWAALPRVIGKKPSDSYYAADGLNQSRVSVDAVLEVIKKVQPLE